VVTLRDIEKAVDIEECEEEAIQVINIETDLVSDIVQQPEMKNIAEEPVLIEANDPDVTAISVEFDPLGKRTVPRSDLLRDISHVQAPLEGPSWSHSPWPRLITLG